MFCMICPAESFAADKDYIDTHMHIFGFTQGGGRRGGLWGRGAPQATGKDFKAAAKNLIRQMDGLGVAKSLVCVVPSHRKQSGEDDYENILNAVNEYPDRLAIMAGGATLNPIIQGTDSSATTSRIRKDFESKAEKLIRDGAKGFGEMLVLHISMSEKHSYVSVPPDHPLFMLLADIAARHDVPIDIHMEVVSKEMPTPEGLDQLPKNPDVLPATIPGFERLLSHNRKAKIVWQHIGWDNTGNMKIGLLRRLLKDHPNLYLSLRVEERPFRIGTRKRMPNRIVGKNWKLKGEWKEFIEEFPDRFVIGSDEFITVPGKSRRFPQSFEETWPILDDLPSDLARKVGHDNAARIYNLD